MYQRSPKKNNALFWSIFSVVSGAVILVALLARVTADYNDSIAISYNTPVSASYSNTNVNRGAGSSTQVKFSENTATPMKGVNNNPWGYDFDNTGNLIYDEIPGSFCKYFKCTPDFWSDSRNGYIVECNDGEYSRTGGYASACVDHGGVDRALYWH
jgi:hypothetical protein